MSEMVKNQSVSIASKKSLDDLMLMYAIAKEREFSSHSLVVRLKQAIIEKLIKDGTKAVCGKESGKDLYSYTISSQIYLRSITAREVVWDECDLSNAIAEFKNKLLSEGKRDIIVMLDEAIKNSTKKRARKVVNF